jgi:rhodanese-related sulfurtransferase
MGCSLNGCHCANRPFTNVTCAQAEKMIKTNGGTPHFVVLDVRTPQEFQTGYLVGAVNLDFRSPDFSDRVAQMIRADTYLVYCRSGQRSANAMGIMKECGFPVVYNLEGGIVKWQADSSRAITQQ